MYAGRVTYCPWQVKLSMRRAPFRACAVKIRNITLVIGTIFLHWLLLYDSHDWCYCYRFMASLAGHTGRVTCLEMAQRSLVLWSASTDETIRKWDVATGHPGLVIK